MLSKMVWMLGIGAGVAALIVSAAARLSHPAMAYLHLAIAAAISVALALAAVRATRLLVEQGAGRTRVAATTARHMSHVWAWGAFMLLATYGTGVLAWKEWWHFFLAAAVIAGLCLIFAATLGKDASSGRDDETMLKLARTVTVIQLVGMMIAMLGLIIDGKMVRFLNPRHTDWAANNIFFFGAAALAAISAHALSVSRGKAT